MHDHKLNPYLKPKIYERSSAFSHMVCKVRKLLGELFQMHGFRIPIAVVEKQYKQTFATGFPTALTQSGLCYIRNSLVVARFEKQMVEKQVHAGPVDMLSLHMCCHASACTHPRPYQVSLLVFQAQAMWDQQAGDDKQVTLQSVLNSVCKTIGVQSFDDLAVTACMKCMVSVILGAICDCAGQQERDRRGL